MSDVMIVAGLVVLGVFMAVLWYLHRQHAKERHAHASELAKLHEQMTALQESHANELIKLQQHHQSELTAHHDALAQQNAEHLAQLGQLQQQIATMTDEFGQKQLHALAEHQTALAQKQQTIATLNERLLEQESQFKLSLDKAIKDAQTRSNNTQRSVLKGQISEKFVPFMAGFEYSPADCRFMGEPVDYVVFHRLHDCADGQADIDEVSVVFLEVKSGVSRLNKRQQILKEAIGRGQVRFESIRIHESSDVKVSLDMPYANLDKQLYPNSGSKWSEAEELRLVQAFDNGASIDELMTQHGRNHGGIISRLKKLGKFQE
ncbi:MAG: Holliday junction resolvase-like protein [Moraxella sp.]|nr:Holliday junction resolvase-like protein [Moraxella sp.]